MGAEAAPAVPAHALAATVAHSCRSLGRPTHELQR